MEQRPFGNSGLTVSVLGLGAGHIGSPSFADADAERLLNGALDFGITLIDTARGYGLSEERIGRYLAHRRNEFVLSTKVGYGIPGCQDWTGPCITAGVEAALKLLRTDRLDVVHLHSCPLDVLTRGDVVEALVKSVSDGKVRVAAYAGENEALEWAVRSGSFGSIQLSVNVCDQRSIDTILPDADRARMGVIAKRPLANTPWRYPQRPGGNDMALQNYWERWQTLHLDTLGIDPAELSLRFAVFAPAVDSAIIGTANLQHLKDNVDLAAKGPLPADVQSAVQDAFRTHGSSWAGQI